VYVRERKRESVFCPISRNFTSKTENKTKKAHGGVCISVPPLFKLGIQKPSGGLNHPKVNRNFAAKIIIHYF
jgi:hypothetical protein